MARYYIDGVKIVGERIRVQFTDLETGENTIRRFYEPVEVLEHFRGTLTDYDAQFLHGALVKWECGLIDANIDYDTYKSIDAFEGLHCLIQFMPNLVNSLIRDEVQDHD